MNEELKPCPFCGSTRIHVNDDDTHVFCVPCGAEMDFPGATSAWNRRWKPPVQQIDNPTWLEHG